MITDPSFVPLSARAWIGNGAFGALVSADGTIDWWCPGGVGSPAALWKLLDPSGGAVRVGPERSGSDAARRLPPANQRYRPGSNVVETTMEGPGGRRLSVVDFLEWPGPGQETSGRIIRVVRALSGPIEVEVEVHPSVRSGASRHAARGISSGAEGMILGDIAVRADLRFEAVPGDRRAPRWQARRVLEEGEGFVVAIETTSAVGPAGPALTVDSALRAAASTEAAWKSWLSVLAYDGPYRAAVERSMLITRCLVASSGAPVSAGSMSLPRRPASERNLDLRWVRWRDVAAAAFTFAATGFPEDAEAAETWLREAVSQAPLPWPAWLDPDGQPAPPVETLGWSGWRRSSPVVAGVPDGVLDIDCYGDVVAAIGACRTGPGGRREEAGPLSAAWPALAKAADWLADHWRDPDVGVWLSGSAARRSELVASRVQAWLALDRMARLARAANPLDLAAVPWQQEARAISDWLEGRSIASDGGLRRVGYASASGEAGDPGDAGDAGDAGDEPDAALLRVAWRGPWPIAHPVVRRTVERILDRLSSGNLVFRHSERVYDGHAGPDNPDLLASLWAVRALATLGRWEEAHERMESVIALSGDSGLLSETADPVSGQLTGNLPCTAVHLALADAALALEKGPA